jgi:SAM-dependent methyltransferase
VRHSAAPDQPGPSYADMESMRLHQEAGHAAGYDYEHGSPHLRHSELRREVVARIRSLVEEQFARAGACRVLEIGAGHGGFTDHIAATGAEVTVTEMSRPSLNVLRERFARNPHVRVLYDANGDAVFSESTDYDLVLCISVLHHIPDYLSFVGRLMHTIARGGAFGSFQDPLWYPRRTRRDLYLDRGAFYLWRLSQDNLLRGLTTLSRRARNVYDSSNPSDMVEYHVVRSGVDEQALSDLVGTRFEQVEQWRYWSTQSQLLQSLGTQLGLANTFGIVARGLACPARSSRLS